MVAVLLCWPSLASAQGRLGTEFQVNSYTIDSQRFPAAAVSTSGDFVVTWESNNQDGSAQGIFARRFTSEGTVVGAEFQVNGSTTADQRLPSVAFGAGGEFLITWVDEADLDGSSRGVFARRFSSTGTPLAGELQVNSYTVGSQNYPSVAGSASGDFVIVWNSPDQDGAAYGVFGRRFASDGTPQAVEFQVNTYTDGYQGYPTVAASPSGDFVVVWLSLQQDGSNYGVFARRFSSAGTALAAEFQVNSFTPGTQGNPSVAVSGAGDFLVAWISYQAGSSYGVFAQSFSSAGEPLAAELQVNAYTTSIQARPFVAADSGGFIVAWSSFGQDGSNYGTFARRFSSSGAPLTGEFQINTYTPGGQLSPGVAAEADGDFVVAWFSAGQDGSDNGIFAQRFAALKPLDIDGDGVALALTDGLLVLRFNFGFTGATLVSNAVNLAGCTRCDATTIEDYLHTLD